MKGSLGNVRRRVEALGRELLPVCQGPHSFLRIENVGREGALPAWAEAELNRECGCGRPLRYFTIVNAIPNDAPSSAAVYPASL